MEEPKVSVKALQWTRGKTQGHHRSAQGQHGNPTIISGCQFHYKRPTIYLLLKEDTIRARRLGWKKGEERGVTGMVSDTWGWYRGPWDSGYEDWDVFSPSKAIKNIQTNPFVF